MTNSLRPVDVIKHVIGDIQRCWRELLVFDVAFQLLRAWLIAPLIALALSFILLNAGHSAVSNHDIISFLLTPSGAMYLTLVTAASAVLIVVEQAGMLIVLRRTLKPAALIQAAERKSLKAFVASLWRIKQLGLLKLSLLSLVSIPFLALAFVTHIALLTRYDIYYYITARPASFWIAICIGLLLLAGLAAVIFTFAVKWILALPIAIFESHPPSAALRASRERIRGAEWSITKLVLMWAIGTLGLGMLLTSCYRLSIEIALSVFGRDSIPVLLTFLAVQSALIAVISFASSATISLLVYQIYCHCTEADTVINRETPGQQHPSANESDLRPASGRIRISSWIAAMLALFGPLTMWSVIADRAALQHTVLVTAHRGFAARAPENTLIAIECAIEIGADYTEIDVHQTRDGVVVLLHDRDFRRVAGDSRRLDELTLEQVLEIDVGKWFSDEFAGTRVPTLEEAIILCKDRIRINIELKVFGPSESLAEAVAHLVRSHELESKCVVTSLSHAVLTHVRRFNPDVPIGMIVGQSIGDLNGIDVDALSVRADHLSDEMIRSAKRLGRKVMVWGVRGERQMTEQFSRGVDNVITSDPQQAIQLRDRWRESCDHDRMVIALRILLGVGAPAAFP